jgi:hypothetical protein
MPKNVGVLLGTSSDSLAGDVLVLGGVVAAEAVFSKIASHDVLAGVVGDVAGAAGAVGAAGAAAGGTGSAAGFPSTGLAASVLGTSYRPIHSVVTNAAA